VTRLAATPLGGQLINVLTDPSELQHFMQWFSNALWEAESGIDPEVLPLYRKVENLLYSYQDGDWSAETFLEILRREAETFGIRPNTLRIAV